MPAMSLLQTLLAGLAGGLLLLAACAPAAEPKPAAPQPAAERPVTEKPAGEKPAAEKPGASQPAAKPKTSVAGVPLDPNARFGGVIRGSYSNEGPTWSSWEEISETRGLINKVSNGLVRLRGWGNDEDWRNSLYKEWHPELATSWEQSADGLTWTYKLRPGVKWSDGVPFTCADVKWSYDSIRTGTGLKRSPRAPHFLAVQDTECADDLTMVFKLKYPKPAFFEVVGSYFNAAMRPKHIYEKNTDPMRQKPPDVGTGPFIIKEWIPGEKLIYVRKADYWDQPFPYADGIDLRFLTASAAATALRAGRLDMFGSSSSSAGGAQADTLIRECQVCTVRELPPGTPGGGKGIASSCSWCPAVMLHFQRPPWNMPEVREAVAYALDKKKASTVYLGWRPPPPACGSYPPDAPWVIPPERCKTIPGFNYDDPEGNKQKARELLAKAGFKPGELKLNFNLWVSYQDLAPFIDEDLKAAGFDVKISIIETARNYDILTAGDFDAHLHGFAIPGNDPDFILYEHFYTGSDRNYNRYSNREFDRLVDEMSRTLDREERWRKARDAMEIALREQAKIPILQITFLPIFNKRVKGYMGTGLDASGHSDRWEYVWIDEGR